MHPTYKRRVGARTKTTVIVHGGVRFLSYRLHILKRRLLVYYVHFCRLVCSRVEPFAFLCPLLSFASLLRLSVIIASLDACLTYFVVVAVCIVPGAALQPNFGEPPLQLRRTRGSFYVLILICTLAFLYPHHVRPYLQHDQFSM